MLFFTFTIAKVQNENHLTLHFALKLPRLPEFKILCGYGAIEGKLTFAFVQDSDRKAGALDGIGADKIEKLYAQAIRVGAPVIGVFDSAGAVVWDGASALSAYGRVMKCVSDASGIIPQIALISGSCTGMASAIAAMFESSSPCCPTVIEP